MTALPAAIKQRAAARGKFCRLTRFCRFWRLCRPITPRGISKLRSLCTVREDRYDGSFARCAEPGLAGCLRGLLLHSDVRRPLRQARLHHVLLLAAPANRLEWLPAPL